jgi:hypothetical protein
MTVETSAPDTTTGQLSMRVLPPEEWSRLQGTEAEHLWPVLDPATAQVLVVERDHMIVGCWTLMTVLHVECLWIAPTDRGRGGVARRLLRFMREMATAAGFRTVVTSAMSDEIRALLAHVNAVPIPGDFYAFRVDKGVH